MRGGQEAARARHKAKLLRAASGEMARRRSFELRISTAAFTHSTALRCSFQAATIMPTSSILIAASVSVGGRTDRRIDC